MVVFSMFFLENELTYNNLKKKSFFYAIILFSYLVIIYSFYPGLFKGFSTLLPHSKLVPHMSDLQSIIGIISNSINTGFSDIYHLPFFYPESYILAKTHPLFGVSFFFIIFKGLGFSIIQSYNLFIILSLLFGGLGCFLLAREFSSTKIFPFIFSFLFIIHSNNFLFFMWPNFMSRYIFPFVLLFIVKYFKSKNNLYLIPIMFLSFLQFMSSVYYGVQLWVFILPVFLITSLILKKSTFREFKYLLIGFFIISILIVLILSPYVSIGQNDTIKKVEKDLIEPADIFSYSKVLSNVFDIPQEKRDYLFPGFVFTLFVTMFFVSLIRKKQTLYAITIYSMIAIMSVLAFKDKFYLDIIFIFFLLWVLSVTIINWKDINRWNKVIIITLFFYFMIFIQFPNISFLKSFSIYNGFNRILPLSGLRAIRRVFIYILPLFIIVAVIGAEGFFLKKKNRLFQLVFPVFILLLMIFENINYSPLQLFDSNDLMALPVKESSDIYKKIPFKKNKVILEIPFYFKQNHRNAFYMYNWMFHQNYILNSKVSHPPLGYYSKLKNILSKFQRKFPSKESIKKLIQNYSVTHIIFHLEKLKNYQRFSFSADKLVQRIENIKDYCRIKYKSSQYIIVKVKEYFKISKVIRTFSMYQLKKKNIIVRLKSVFDGIIKIKFNDVFLFSKRINAGNFKISLKKRKLNIHGNKVEIIFGSDIILKDIAVEFDNSLTQNYNLIYE